MSDIETKRDGQPLKVHIKNNRAGEAVFRVTQERYEAARARHPEVARRVETSIGWDLDDFEDRLREAEVLLTWDLPTQDLATRAPCLKWIQVIGAGVEHLLPLDWLPDGVRLLNNRGVHAAKAREYALMALLMLNARLPALIDAQRARRAEAVFTPSIAGRRLLVVGAGHMGAAVGAAGKSLGLEVIGINRHGRPRAPFDAVMDPSALETQLPLADFVALTTPLTAETRGLMDARRLAVMKPGSGLINMSRGQVLDQDALAARLADGYLSGAIIDVTDPEPLPADASLWEAPNLVITPHVSSDDVEAYIPLTLDRFFENIARHLGGRPLIGLVDPTLGY
jgi:phosphoglycerate dehydrogenase-like enzyme